MSILKIVSIIQIISGFIAAITEIILIKNGRGNGTGIWTGIFFGMSGLVGFFNPQDATKTT